jgi:hypothetical protein
VTPRPIVGYRPQDLRLPSPPSSTHTAVHCIPEGLICRLQYVLVRAVRPKCSSKAGTTNPSGTIGTARRFSQSTCRLVTYPATYANVFPSEAAQQPSSALRRRRGEQPRARPLRAVQNRRLPSASLRHKWNEGWCHCHDRARQQYRTATRAHCLSDILTNSTFRFCKARH